MASHIIRDAEQRVNESLEIMSSCFRALVQLSLTTAVLLRIHSYQLRYSFYNLAKTIHAHVLLSHLLIFLAD
jgi:hypothetical protein